MSNRQQKCCCAVQACSSAAKQHNQPVLLPDQEAVVSTRGHHFYLTLHMLLLFNTIELVYSLIIIIDYKLVSIGSDKIVSLVMLTVTSACLISWSSSYVIINFIRRRSMNSWNQSFATILQGFLLACFLTEGFQALLVVSYTKSVRQSTEHVFVTGIPLYTSDNLQKERIDWIQTQFTCCGFTANATADWMFGNSSTATSILPNSCCSLGISRTKCSTKEYSYNVKNCPVAVEDALSGLLNGYTWICILGSISHFIYLLYIYRVFYLYRSIKKQNHRVNLNTIFAGHMQVN